MFFTRTLKITAEFEAILELMGLEFEAKGTTFNIKGNKYNNYDKDFNVLVAKCTKSGVEFFDPRGRRISHLPYNICELAQVRSEIPNIYGVLSEKALVRA